MTAVEWLINEHFGGLLNCTPDFRKRIEQAKEMENVQREKDFIEGYKKRTELSGSIFDEISEDCAKILFKETSKLE